MELKARLSNLGVEFSFDFSENQGPLEPAADASQTSPRRSYVYAHRDEAGRIFYIGKGIGRRAWSTDRDPLWHRYVGQHLHGKYSVQVLQDNLSDEEAEHVEAQWIAQCDADSLVNWENMSRKVNYAALERHGAMRGAIQAAVSRAKELERSDPERAVADLIAAIDAFDADDFRHSTEPGIIGQLMDDEGTQYVHPETLLALDRLTLCLVRLGRGEEARQRTEAYFAKFPEDRQSSRVVPIIKRVEKAAKKGVAPGI